MQATLEKLLHIGVSINIYRVLQNTACKQTIGKMQSQFIFYLIKSTAVLLSFSIKLREMVSSFPR